jgi:sugar lactone lactonase YvrE
MTSGVFQALAAPAATSPFIKPFNKVSTIASTVPSNGDVNPYGLVTVPNTVGKLIQGYALVSNFNNGQNLQGTGTTIVEISPSGTPTLFAQIDPKAITCPGGVGLTTALVVLKRGWVIVGSLPTSDGTSATMQAGCLIVLDSQGHVVETFSGDGINGPWDMTARDDDSTALLFVTNVLNNTVAASPNVVHDGTVLRIPLTVPNQGAGKKPSMGPTTVIGSDFAERTDPSALVVGPTGVGLASDGTLYVADSVNSSISAIPNATGRSFTAFTGNVVTSNGFINDPLGLTIANGDILTVNGADGNIVETTPAGAQVAHRLLDNTVTHPSPPTVRGSGCLFGVAAPDGTGVYFVDDCDNTLKFLH